MKSKKLGLIRGKEDLRDKTTINYLKLNTDIPESHDLKNRFTPIEDQKELGSCTANAIAGIVEFYEKNILGKYLNLSRLFTYKVTRKFEGVSKGDTGATIRGTLGSIRLFGACPESYYKYDITKYDNEPTAFHYALANNYKGVDYANIGLEDSTALVDKIKMYIGNNVPVVCGIEIFSSFYEDENGTIPLPLESENSIGGHAIVLSGYDKDHIYFRNSWGTIWGDDGYGKLPIDYIKKYAFDFWILSKINYVSLSQFK